MPTVLQDLLASKKFIFVLLVTVLLLAAAKFSLITAEDAQTFLKYLWPAYLGAQGLADLGKAAADSKAKTDAAFLAADLKADQSPSAEPAVKKDN